MESGTGINREAPMPLLVSAERRKEGMSKYGDLRNSILPQGGQLHGVGLAVCNFLV